MAAGLYWFHAALVLEELHYISILQQQLHIGQAD